MNLYVPGLDALLRRARDENIRRCFYRGFSVKRLSAAYGVTERTVRDVLVRPHEPLHPELERLLREVTGNG